MHLAVSTLQLGSDLLGRYTKLQERLKAERRALKILRTSAADERGLRAQTLLTGAALPCVVGESAAVYDVSAHTAPSEGICLIQLAFRSMPFLHAAKALT